jgi:small subunit ribosomal protein S16
MVKIRLARHGRKKVPIYRIVAADIRAPRDGRYLERVGWYDPRAKDDSEKVKLKVDRYEYWLSKGAKPTETVARLATPFLKNAEEA